MGRLIGLVLLASVSGTWILGCDDRGDDDDTTATDDDDTGSGGDDDDDADDDSGDDDQPTWDFGDYAADVVVVNLGANDIYGANENAVRQRYVTLLDLLRTAHPGTPIVVFNGWGWDSDEPADYTAEVVAAYGDPDVSVATFPWVFEQWHGCEYDHGGMAR